MSFKSKKVYIPSIILLIFLAPKIFFGYFSFTSFGLLGIGISSLFVNLLAMFVIKKLADRYIKFQFPNKYFALILPAILINCFWFLLDDYFSKIMIILIEIIFFITFFRTKKNVI